MESSQQTDSDRLLTPDEAAAMLRAKRGTLAHWRCRKAGPGFVRVGGRIRYPQSAIRRYLEAHTVALAAAA